MRSMDKVARDSWARGLARLLTVAVLCAASTLLASALVPDRGSAESARTRVSLITDATAISQTSVKVLLFGEVSSREEPCRRRRVVLHVVTPDGVDHPDQGTIKRSDKEGGFLGDWSVRFAGDQASGPDTLNPGQSAKLFVVAPKKQAGTIVCRRAVSRPLPFTMPGPARPAQ